MAVSRFQTCAILGDRALLTELARGWPGAKVVDLDEAIAAIPLLRPLQLQLNASHPLGLRRGAPLPTALAEALAAGSLTSPVVYFEAEFVGSLGAQASIVWVAGEVALGPLVIDLESPPAGQRVPPVSDFPVNRALRHVGVRARPGHDEWDTLRLGRLVRAKELEQLLETARAPRVTRTG